jgi:hypothetical protein
MRECLDASTVSSAEEGSLVTAPEGNKEAIPYGPANAEQGSALEGDVEAVHGPPNTEQESMATDHQGDSERSGSPSAEHKARQEEVELIHSVQGTGYIPFSYLDPMSLADVNSTSQGEVKAGCVVTDVSAKKVAKRKRT